MPTTSKHHEWLGVSLAGAFLFHILLHWRWLYATTSRFFGKLVRQSRINFILNLALLIAFTVLILSGILISEEVLPFLGLQGSRDMTWKWLHTISTAMPDGEGTLPADFTSAELPDGEFTSERPAPPDMETDDHHDRSGGGIIIGFAKTIGQMAVVIALVYYGQKLFDRLEKRWRQPKLTNQAV